MTSNRINLEQFELDGLAPSQETPEFLRGYAQGKAETLETLEARETASLEELASMVGDMTFGYEDARQAVLAKLQPMLAQLAEVIVPKVLRETFASHLADHILEQFDDASTASFRVEVHPDQYQTIKARLSGLKGPVEFVGNPELTPGQAILDTNPTPVFLDLTALEAALQAALHGLETSERKLSNG